MLSIQKTHKFMQHRLRHLNFKRLVIASLLTGLMPTAQASLIANFDDIVYTLNNGNKLIVSILPQRCTYSAEHSPFQTRVLSHVRFTIGPKLTALSSSSTLSGYNLTHVAFLNPHDDKGAYSHLNAALNNMTFHIRQHSGQLSLQVLLPEPDANGTMTFDCPQFGSDFVISPCQSSHHCL